MNLARGSFAKAPSALIEKGVLKEKKIGAPSAGSEAIFL
jgi:hypothetical protein